ncbi:MAG: hypothetical protein FWC22_01675 [Treponema sp.]|nr:hypothetical protein [Treponema sp.]
MKRMWLVIFCLIFSTQAFAQTAVIPWWLSLEYGKQRFRTGDYGDALLLFEDARRDRRAMYEKMEKDLISLLSINEVRRLGDHLDWVERYSQERYYTAATAALEELYYRVPKSGLKNSASAALAAIGKLKNYPEAEYWIGEVYRIEGELPLALSQYRRAYEMRENLEDAMFSVTLQYNIAGILRTRQDYNGMERALSSIISEHDTLWINADRALTHRIEFPETGRSSVPVPYEQAEASFARTSMIKILENSGFNRFLELYRYNNITVEQAHRLLGFHYVVTGRPSAQEHLMFAFLIQNSIIIEELRKRQFDFTYTNLQALAQEINKNELLLSFVEEVEYYKTAYYFAASLFRNDRASVARNIWEFLASEPNAGEWQNRAASQLRNPRTETIITMP